MRVFIVFLCLLLASSALAAPVDPNAPDGAAAYYVDGRVTYILRTNGEVWSRAHSRVPLPDWYPMDSSVFPPVPVANITDWYFHGFRTNSGELWGLCEDFECSEAEWWRQLMPLPWEAVGSNDQEDLGNLKSIYR